LSRDSPLDIPLLNFRRRLRIKLPNLLFNRPPKLPRLYSGLALPAVT
jgi:hypothetical protein